MTRYTALVGLMATVGLAAWAAAATAPGAPAAAKQGEKGAPPAAAPTIERRVTGLVVTVPPGLPAALKVALKNTGSQAVEVPNEGFGVVSVEKEGVAARDLWTLQAAAALAGEGWPVRALFPRADKVIAVAPSGPYAAYALWLKANFLARHAADIREMNLAAYFCDAILERHPDVAAQDEVFEGLFTVCQAGGQAARAREAAADLAAAFPQSLSLARVRQAGGDAARVSAASAAGAGVPVAISGLDQVPQGPREVLDAYWRSAAKGRLLAVSGVLARDFMGGFGTRVEHLEHLSGLIGRAAGGEIRVAVRKAAMADAYDRPVSLPSGEERSWRGHICIIDGTVSVPGTADRSGRDAASEPIKASWALLEYPAGTWKLISETSADRNLSVGALACKLLYDLNTGFPSWHLSDGRRDRFPYEEVKRQAGVAGKVVDERTEWDSHTLVVASPARDQVVLSGQVRMLLKAEAGPAARETWVARSVQVTLAVDDRGALVLKDLTVSAAVEQPLLGPESDRPPSPRHRPPPSSGL